MGAGSRCPPNCISMLLQRNIWITSELAFDCLVVCIMMTDRSSQKNVMISHKNVIANTLQMSTYESNYKSGKPESLLAVLPMSHSYALIVTGHSGVYRGYNAVVLPGFDLVDVLEAVQKHLIETLWMVRYPPVPPYLGFIIRKRSDTNVLAARYLP